jgi:hypothetical protein
MTKLLEKDVKFDWSQQCEDIFLTLKKLLTTAPVLAQPNIEKSFDVYCDASGIGIEGVLMQDGHAIAYASCQLRCHEEHYPTHDLELLAVVHALKVWRYYLLGNLVHIYTDHRSLKYLFTRPNLNMRRRWLELIKDYELEIHYHPKKTNVMSDALSRKHHCNHLMAQSLTSCCDPKEPSLWVVPHATLTIIALILTIKEEVIAAQRTYTGMGHIRRRLRLGEVKCFHEDANGVLWFKNCQVVPKDVELHHKITDEAHCSRYSIHPGTNKMYQDLNKNFWWTRMKQEKARYVVECDTYHRVKADHLRTANNLQPLSVPEWKWEDICMDFIMGLPRTSCGHDLIWVIVDRLTKSAHFIPIGTRYRVRQYTELYIAHIIRYHSIPRTIISDKGYVFVARFLEQLHECLGTHLI